MIAACIHTVRRECLKYCVGVGVAYSEMSTVLSSCASTKSDEPLLDADTYVCLSVSVCLHVCPSVCLSVCLSICLSVCLSVCYKVSATVVAIIAEMVVVMSYVTVCSCNANS